VGTETLVLGKGSNLKTIEIEDETLRFLAWLARQDVTLPSVIVDYLKWNQYTKKEIEKHFLALHMACLEAEKE
jgi:hypothetical protein